MDWTLQSGSVFTAAGLNQQFSLPLDYLVNPPMFQGLNLSAVSQTLGTTGITAQDIQIPFDTPTVDPWGCWNQQTDNTIWWTPNGMAGMWLYSGSVALVPTAGQQYQAVTQAGLGIGGWATGQATTMGTASSPVVVHVVDLLPAWAQAFGIVLMGYTNPVPTMTTYVQTGSGNNTPSVASSFSGRWVANNPVMTPLPEGYSFPLTVPSPQAWTNTTALTSAGMNSQVRDAITFLANVPYVRVNCPSGGGQSIPSSVSTVLTNLSQDNFVQPSYGLDPWNTWNESTSTWTAPIDGVYLCCCRVSFPFPGSSYFNMYPGLTITTSGTTSNYSGSKSYSTGPAAMVIRTFRFKAGDTIRPYVYQSASTAQTVHDAVFFTLWLRS